MNRSLSLVFAQLFGRGSNPSADIASLTDLANERLDDDRVRVRLADAHLAAGHQKEAITWYWEAARINVRVGRAARATALMKRVLAIDPECVRALVEIARAEQAKENYHEASRYYRAAAKLRQKAGYAEEAHGLFRRATQVERLGNVGLIPDRFPYASVGSAAA